MIPGPSKEKLRRDLSDFICKTIDNRKEEDETIFVVNIDDIIAKHHEWQQNLPKIKPCYAVKCNPDPMLLQVLAALGTGFDCASKAEIKAVLDITSRPEGIVYANPCKSNSSLKYAVKMDITKMVFDNEVELYKISRLAPNAELIIRIKVDDSDALCKFSSKFGAKLSVIPDLLALAQKLKLNVMGISFHVGSPCTNAQAYERAIKDARKVFDILQTMGIQVKLLDIGGGFPNAKTSPVSFTEIAEVIKVSLDKYFPDDGEGRGLDIISEPGRFYSASSFTLCTQIIGKRMEHDEASGEIQAMYYLSNGLFGSFLFLLFEDHDVTPIPIYLEANCPRAVAQDSADSRSTFKTILWGPTCDGYDIVKKDFVYPEMELDEWMVFTFLGAYSAAIQTDFNGFGFPTFKYFFSDQAYQKLRSASNWNQIVNLLQAKQDDWFKESKKYMLTDEVKLSNGNGPIEKLSTNGTLCEKPSPNGTNNENDLVV